ncbi:MAG: DMT family transporter, partial [Alphaproteobacteria bacterium]|nr:DMT family transporter [Alphaproteobacteria bacterium]
ADERRGILWMLLTMFLYVSMNAVAKELMQTYPVPQVVWARYFFQMVFVVLLLRHRLARVIVTGSLKLQLGRSLMLLCSSALFFTAMSLLPLAEITAIMFVGPLLVTALSMPILGEHVGPRRWTGVAVGFLGALIIIRPGLGVMQAAALLPLGAAFSYAIYEMTTRLLSRTDRAVTTLVYSASIGAIATSLVAPSYWLPPDPLAWFMLVSMGVLAGAGHFAVIKALEAARAATVTPFGYTTLLWAIFYGFVLFDELPDAWTLFGAGTIVLSGLYIFNRERALRAEREADRRDRHDDGR